MAKNRIMAAKNAKVKRCDAENRKENRMRHMLMQYATPSQTQSRLNVNNEVLESLRLWHVMYEEL